MAVATPEARTAPAAAAAPTPSRRVGHVVALVLICLTAAALTSWRVAEADLGNTYYSAAVKSMLASPTNFLFGAADPSGVVSVDKPPLALWLQVLSVRLLGFTSWGLFLPQVVAGVATVFVLHRAVRPWAGERAALIAAAVMATTPVTVALNRHNNTDTLLILLLVLAAWALTRGLHTTGGDRRRSAWFVAAAALIGLGFNAKMLEAWIVVPAFVAAVCLGVAGRTWRARLGDLLRSCAVLLVVSFSWSALRDLWTGEKPYMGGTVGDSAFELVFGYNGFGALLGSGQSAGGSGLDVPLAVVGLFGGAAGLGRMFSPETGGQIAWLLPLCAVLLLHVGATAYQRAWRAQPFVLGPAAGGWALWGGWLALAFTVLSFTEGIFNAYYVSLLVPAVGAVTGAGLVRLWDAQRAGDRLARATLAVGVLATGVTALVLVGRSADWHGWIGWVAVLLCLVAAAALATGLHRSARPLALVVVAVLAGSASWSVASAASAPTSGGFPKAGPVNERFEAMRDGVLIPVELTDLPMPAPAPGDTEIPTELPPELLALTDPEHTGPVRAGGFAGHEMSPENAAALAYAREHADGAPITLLTEGGGLASSEFILDSDEAVVGMGGFLGADPVPSVGTLTAWQRDGTMRFVLSAAPGPDRVGGIAGMGGAEARARVDWVQASCTVVDPREYGGTPFTAADDLPLPGYGDAVLYDCG
jgi:4-amino-4-deoxy-L-arabinose transferase-like glycosyltransferase